MSREIKFRAWDKNNKEYLWSSNDGLNMEALSILAGRFKNWKLEQYTGLKDKNGKEIYKGDIVDEHNGDVVGKIVQITSGEWRIEWIGIFGGSSSLYSHASLCRVIGNIHENPELLGKEKK